jgi:hypothetical protein
VKEKDQPKSMTLDAEEFIPAGAQDLSVGLAQRKPTQPIATKQYRRAFLPCGTLIFTALTAGR